MIRFLEIDVNAPTVCPLAEGGLRTSVVDTPEPKHEVSLFEDICGEASMRLFWARGYQEKPLGGLVVLLEIERIHANG
jgi:hypothetical protein